MSFTALVENGNKLKVVQVKGVDKQAEDQVSSLGKFVEGDGWQNSQKKADWCWALVLPKS